jgi:hypothetical protein
MVVTSSDDLRYRALLEIYFSSTDAPRAQYGQPMRLRPSFSTLHARFVVGLLTVARYGEATTQTTEARVMNHPGWTRAPSSQSWARRTEHVQKAE